MSINIGQVNDPDVIKLAGLMQQKEILIRDMRNVVKRLDGTEHKAMLDIQFVHDRRITALRSNERLKDAIDSQSEWIIDRIYDTAIQNIEKEIAPLADKVMQNLIEANSRTIKF
ncbi:hypothetical protein ACTXMK_05200 [Psychrobacter celer]|jgi:hypothetical protein|uniref:hypothetical protein n=2 Tax=Moraxellaceae TaxID=468 RepID=UPI0025794F53|nr:hypothetical protein [Psychrobacter sp. UBA3068]